MATEIQLLQRAVIRGLADDFRVSPFQIPTGKMPGDYALARATTAGQTVMQWLQAKVDAVEARLTSGVVAPDDPHPDGSPRGEKESQWHGCWVRLDEAVRVFQHHPMWDAADAETARAAHVIKVRRQVLHEEIKLDYIDWLFGF